MMSLGLILLRFGGLPPFFSRLFELKFIWRKFGMCFAKVPFYHYRRVRVLEGAQAIPNRI